MGRMPLHVFNGRAFPTHKILKPTHMTHSPGWKERLGDNNDIPYRYDNTLRPVLAEKLSRTRAHRCRHHRPMCAKHMVYQMSGYAKAVRVFDLFFVFVFSLCVRCVAADNGRGVAMVVCSCAPNMNQRHATYEYTNTGCYA